MAATDTLPQHFVLELDLAIARGGSVGVLFDFGDGIYGENSSVANVPPGDRPATVRLTLPTQPIRGMRFDPTADDQPVLITGMRLLDDRGRLLATHDPRRLGPRYQIQSIVPEGAGVRVTPTLKADDPMLRVDFAPLQKAMHDAMQRPTVGRGSIVGLAVAIAALFAIALVGAARTFGVDRATRFAGAAIFATVFGARLGWLYWHGRPVPFWDEWEGDALYILIPFQGGFLDWGALVMPQWEHRILITRTITLFGTVLNGEWDPRVAMTVGAAMFSALVALLGMAVLNLRNASGVVAMLALTAWAALPFDTNNLLWGGQTQMYALALTVAGSFAIAVAPRVTALSVAAAVAVGALSLFTMGAGLVAPGLATGVCLVRWFWEREQRRGLAALGSVFFAAALVGVLTHVTSRQHLPLYAKSFAEFQKAFVGVLAWPLAPRVALAALIWVPWIANGLLVVRRRGGTPLEWLGIALGMWGLVNAIALGYARPYEGPPFDSRFFTPLSLGALGSLCSSLSLARRAAASRWRARFALTPAAAVLGGLLWCGGNGIAFTRETGGTRAELDHRMRHYLSTGERALVVEKPPAFVAEGVIEKLDTPELQRILPAPYRRALAVRDPTVVGPAASIAAGPVTLSVRTLMKCGPVLMFAGVIALGWCVWRMRLGPKTKQPASHEAGWTES